MWKPLDMPGIPREVAEHTLKILLGSKPMKQRLCHFDEEKCRAIGEEIAKLLAAGFIREVHHPEWLANPVLVQKKQEMEDVCRLHGPQQGVPEGPISFAMNRLNSQFHLRVRNPLLP